MSYTALYRKFRPDNFDDVKGQEHIVTTLKNEIRTERIGHAYLFCGTRGTGKTTIAKILAKAVNCEHPIDGSPCNECSMCRKINRHTSMNVVEIDAASNNGVANIRDIIDEVQYSPAEGKYKVYIIDEVHMLSTGAFNALLKTLEEPPSYVIFILATTEAHKIPVTILSRCQRYDFRRISADTITARMKELTDSEGVEAEDKALAYIAKIADGSLRDALSLLDQCIAFYFGQKLSYENVLDVLGAVDTSVYSEMFNNIINSDVIGCTRLIDSMLVSGRDLNQFITEFIWYLRNLLLIKYTGDVDGIIDASDGQLANMKEEAGKISADVLSRYIYILSELSGQIRYASQKRVLAEIAFIKLCKPQMDTKQDLSLLISRIEELERKIENISTTGIHVDIPQEDYNVPVAREKAQIPENIPAAVPDDVKEVVKNWNSILSQLGRSGQTMLEGVKRSVSENGELLLGFADPVSEGYFKQDDSRQLEALKTIISNITGKDINIKTMVLEEKADNAFVDLSQLIHFDDVEYR